MTGVQTCALPIYGDLSHRVMRTLEQFSPDVEIYSIDEAFISLKGFERQGLTEYCYKIRETVKQWTGIPVSIGIARTKTLAKVANHIAKKNLEYNGVLNILDSERINEYLERTEVSEVWGVGRQYTKFLQNNNIFNALELSKANDKWIKKNMTVMGLRTVYELRGTPCINLEYAVPSKKAIVSSRSFGKSVNSIQDVKEAVATFTSRAAEKMRKQESAAFLLTVFIRTNPFKNEPQYHNGVLVQMPVPSDSTAELISYAMKGVEQIFREGYLYKKVGIMLTGFVHKSTVQNSLFDKIDRVKMTKITETMDKINSDYGSGSLFYAATGISREWKTRAELKSQRFTTSWDDLPIVSAK